MRANRGLLGLMVVALSGPAWAQWQSESDGSDGTFNPAGNIVVELGQAATLCDCDNGGVLNDPCRWDCPSPDPGKGVYDATNWVVVYKYSSINIPAGVTVTFNMHPSGAPVAWLATGNVTINGQVTLDGEDGAPANPPIIPYYTRPGPGGFEGAQADHSGSGAKSFGLGPGSSPTNPATGVGVGAGASHANSAPGCNQGTPTGSAYGNTSGMPLMGGSGGNEDPDEFSSAGGAGGGAILIAAPALLSIGTAGLITAQGGDSRGGGIGSNNLSGGGSGGTIRLRAETVSVAAGGQINARGGVGSLINCCGNICATGADGWVRIEASTVNNSGTISGSQSFPGAPSPVFAASPPRIFITSICNQSVSSDPMWGMKTADVELNSATACTVNIGSIGVPANTIVQVRVIPARGNIITANSTLLTVGGTATASVTFPAGRSEIQLRANW